MKLLLGGGEQTRDGFTNIDILKMPTVDIVHDLNVTPWPIEDNSVDEVIANYILSHLRDTNAVMEELYRVCRHDARVEIKVPFYQSEGAFKDPTHVHFFTDRSFEYYDRDYIENDMVGTGKLPDYQLKSDFKMEKLTYNYYTRGTRFIPGVSLLRRFLWNVVKSIVVILRVNKP